MNFTFAEWNLIRQAVQRWAETSEEQMQKSTPSNEEHSCYRIFRDQMVELRRIEKKINEAVI